MPLISSLKLAKIVHKLMRNVSWPAMLTLMLLQAAITYLLLLLAGEIELIAYPIQFIYLLQYGGGFDRWIW